MRKHTRNLLWFLKCPYYAIFKVANIVLWKPAVIGQSLSPSSPWALAAVIGQSLSPSSPLALAAVIGQSLSPSSPWALAAVIGQSLSPSSPWSLAAVIGQSLSPSSPWALAAVIGQSLSPSSPWALAAVIGQSLSPSSPWALAAVIGQSRNPSSPWALAAVIGQMAQSFVIGVEREWQPMGGDYANVLLCDVQLKQNKIRIPNDSFRRLWAESFFFFNRLTLFIVHCRLHNFADSLCSHTATWHTAWKVIFKGTLRNSWYIHAYIHTYLTWEQKLRLNKKCMIYVQMCALFTVCILGLGFDISWFDSHSQAYDLIRLPIILDIYQVQYMPNFQGKKSLN